MTREINGLNYEVNTIGKKRFEANYRDKNGVLIEKVGFVYKLLLEVYSGKGIDRETIMEKRFVITQHKNKELIFVENSLNDEDSHKLYEKKLMK